MAPETSDLLIIAERLERLEKQNRRLKRAGIGVICVMATLLTVATAQTVPQVVSAHEFDFVDSGGHVRGTLTMGNGMPALSLYSSAGMPMAQLWVSSSGGTLSLMNSTADKNILLKVDDSGPQIQVSDVEHHVAWHAP